MRYMKQLGIILALSLAGEALSALVPLPVPGSIYGLALLFIGLCTGLLRLEQVRDTGKFLVEIMPVLFIPAAAGLLDSWPVLEPVWAPVAVITLVSTVLVMAVTGRVTQRVLRGKERKEGGEHE